MNAQDDAAALAALDREVEEQQRAKRANKYAGMDVVGVLEDPSVLDQIIAERLHYRDLARRLARIVEAHKAVFDLVHAGTAFIDRDMQDALQEEEDALAAVSADELTLLRAED